jgi:mono/diheme cytochrome c family protein
MAALRPRIAILLALFAALAAAKARGADEVDAARQRWEHSPYGPMLERILPPGFTPEMLPERGAPGARLVLRYCVQCHNLPNPAMHHAEKWPKVVERMAERMRGKGNLGRLMSEMMAGVLAPSAAEEGTLVAYLGKHAQRPLDPQRYPEVFGPAGEAFRLACQQCHVLPDPRRHTAAEWRAVVARMERNMQWMNRVVGSQPTRGEPQLRIQDINRFLARHARR